MSTTSTKPPPPARKPRKPTVVYSLLRQDDGTYQHLQFPSSSTPTPTTTPAPSTTPAPIATSSSTPHPRIQTHVDVLKGLQYISMPRGVPSNFYTHRPTISEMERAKERQRGIDTAQAVFMAQASSGGKTTKRPKRGAGDSTTGAATGKRSPAKKKATTAKSRAAMKRSMKPTPRAETTEGPVGDDAAAAAGPARRVARRKTQPSSLGPNRVTKTRSNSKTKPVGAGAAEVDVELVESESAIPPTTTKSPSPSKGKGKGNAKERNPSPKSIPPPIPNTQYASSSSSSSSVSPILTPSPELHHAVEIISDSSPNNMEIDITTGIEVKKELLSVTVTDIPVPAPSHSPSPAPSVPSSKRKRSGTSSTDTSGTSEVVEMPTSTTRSGRVVKRRKME
ncbi:hypothetical protein M422DRAFT_49590 [Sphaerobolus stellatus SS14]|uniref:Uncharacterized protein n=1 Tax=Sphaerobolus stellatus (strain SS14) TaxID=990650 RepID=A0A0C9VNW1_SPHS4|nr:hypothetical protein M422DRAFT_49590 [Sphaerobolus stellatus SS14]